MPPDKWAATWQNKQNECAPSEDSDQPGQSAQSVQSFRCPHEETLSPELHLERKRRLWSDWADALAESSLGAHSFCWFCHVAAQIIFWNIHRSHTSVWFLLAPLRSEVRCSFGWFFLCLSHSAHDSRKKFAVRVLLYLSSNRYCLRGLSGRCAEASRQKMKE